MRFRKKICGKKLDLFRKEAFQELKKNFQILEKQQTTETWELCSDHLVDVTRPENIRRKHLISEQKLATGMEKQQATETQELCSIHLVNKTRPETQEKQNFQLFDNSAYRPLYYFSSLNRLPVQRIYKLKQLTDVVHSQENSSS